MKYKKIDCYTNLEQSLIDEWDLTDFTCKRPAKEEAEQKLKDAEEEIKELKRKSKKVKFSEDELNELIDIRLRPSRDLNQCLIDKLTYDNQVLQKEVKTITFWTLIKNTFKSK